MSDVSESVGRYLSHVHLLTARSDRRAGTGELAAELDVSAASVTEMLRGLDERGLADYEKYEGVALTDAGEATAREFLWRRCVAENFLEDDLGLDPAALDDDPRAFGQELSPEAIDRLRALVDHPCDGQCNAPRDEYAACTDEVREAPSGPEP
ncbi:metal-dependent transcriptional regulator [Halorussus marinus]|uniref:metal-dependent transcriptional regulator n=1 Tax=Halorussus marinus TaxID=2505976 RepID=UPI00106E2225|nr:metal-dependent transcriptional regulator [Halorussus marinus]